ncbi:MAG: hypothetical protein AB7S80_08345 [Rhizobiaceae bacterium]
MTTPSATYQLFEAAMRERRPVVCVYHGHRRAVCPAVLGHSDGVETALVFQYAGGSSGGVVTGDWKCLKLAGVDAAELIDGIWQAGGGDHTSAQTCVKDVDLDVNPASPFGPRRRL